MAPSVLHMPTRDDAVDDLDQAEAGRNQVVRAGSHGDCPTRTNQRPPVPRRQVPRRPGGLEGGSCLGKAPTGGSEFDAVSAILQYSYTEESRAGGSRVPGCCAEQEWMNRS